METFYTKRLILRGWTLSDAEDLFSWATNPHIGPRAGWKPHQNILESLTIINKFMETNEVWAIVDRTGGHVIGSIGLHEDRHRKNLTVRSIGYVLDEKYWGQGLILEAIEPLLEFGFTKLNLSLISVCHYPFNIQSKRVIEKAGFKYEGTLKKATTLYDGQVMDDVCYSMDKEQYFLNKK